MYGRILADAVGGSSRVVIDYGGLAYWIHDYDSGVSRNGVAADQDDGDILDI